MEKEIYPYGSLSDWDVNEAGERCGSVTLELASDSLSLEVIQWGEWNCDSDISPEPRRITIELEDDVSLASLAGFIQALIFRYNRLVKETNETASQCRMQPLNLIDTEASHGGEA